MLTRFVAETTALSTVEFDVLWETQKLPSRHAALWTPSPGATHSERREIVERVWSALHSRGLARGNRPSAELMDLLELLSHPKMAFDCWVWREQKINARAVSNGSSALLAVLKADQVLLTPVHSDSLAEAAVSVAGEKPAGAGRSVSMPYSVLKAADDIAAGDTKALISVLHDQKISWGQAHDVAQMLNGVVTRGQFGAEVTGRDFRVHRAERVVAFHDNEAGRYLMEIKPGEAGEKWCTIAPANNQLLADRLKELLTSIRW